MTADPQSASKERQGATCPRCGGFRFSAQRLCRARAAAVGPPAQPTVVEPAHQVLDDPASRHAASDNRGPEVAAQGNQLGYVPQPWDPPAAATPYPSWAQQPMHPGLPVHPVGAPRRRVRVWAIAAAVPLVVVAAGIAVAGLGLINHHRAPLIVVAGCPTAPAPAGASPAAIAYLQAVERSTPGWNKIDATLASENDITHHDDLLSEITVDTGFRNSLTQIAFPPQVAPDATALTDALDSYIQFLSTAALNHGYLAQHATDDYQLNEARSEASGQLRQALGLPPSTCGYRRP